MKPSEEDSHQDPQPSVRFLKSNPIFRGALVFIRNGKECLGNS